MKRLFSFEVTFRDRQMAYVNASIKYNHNEEEICIFFDDFVNIELFHIIHEFSVSVIDRYKIVFK